MELCFEHDWNHGAYKRFIKDPKDLNLVRNFLKPRFKKIKDFYKHYSSLTSSSIAFGIGPNLMNEIFTKMDAFDDRVFNVGALGIEMTKTNATGKLNKNSKSQNNLRNLICRHEFMELLVRCAENKFLIPKKEETHYDSIIRFYNAFCDSTFYGYDSQAFRDEGGYWSEEVEYVYEKYRLLVNHLFSV